MEIKLEIRISGKRAGEKNYEELMIEEEARNAYELEEMFMVPQMLGQVSEEKALRSGYLSKDMPLLTKQEIKKLLRDIVKP